MNVFEAHARIVSDYASYIRSFINIADLEIKRTVDATLAEGKLQERLAKLLRCVAALDEMKLEGDQAVGVSIVKRALGEPIRQIVVNAGVEGAVIVMEVKKNKKVAFGFNAASIAGLMITTECVITDKPGDDKKMGGMPGGMGGGDMY